MYLRCCDCVLDTILLVRGSLGTKEKPVNQHGRVVCQRGGGEALSRPAVIFVEFTYSIPEGERKYYFVGESEKAILDDTCGGKEFGGLRFTSLRQVSFGHVRALRLAYFETGAFSVQGGKITSFSLGSPREWVA